MRTRTLGTDPVYKPKGLRSDCSTSVLANLNHSNTRGWRVPLGNWTWNFPKESSWENFTSSCPTELSNLDHDLDDWIFIYRNRYIEIEKTLRIIYTSFLFSYYWNLCSFCFLLSFLSLQEWTYSHIFSLRKRQTCTTESTFKVHGKHFEQKQPDHKIPTQ